ncbi:ent-kaurene oxidase [Diaporthe helianthi]|uniref:Ent-kaurene oxidase n=1 Tax=Diaporthe helianthi TaxID=158607 RepID=A0A2P5HKX6_DIAHE|nr:ent-kaurene oxidase [Diaporthe helianthi]
MNSPAILLASVALAAVALWPRVRGWYYLRHYPLLRKEHSWRSRMTSFMASAGSLLKEGGEKYGENPYRLTSANGTYLIVPNRLIDELKALPDSDIDAFRFLENDFEQYYTKLFPPREQFPVVISTASVTITRSLDPEVQLNPVLSAETDRSVKAAFGTCPEWKSVHLYPKVLDVVASVSGSVLVGKDLCRRPEYLTHAKGYGVDLLTAALHLKKYPAPLKPFVARFSHHFKTIKRERKELVEFMTPIIKEREAMIVRGEKLPLDALTAVIKECRQRQDWDLVEAVCKVQMFLIFNTIQTTTASVTRLLYDLSTDPKTANALRAEMRQVLAENGGVWTTKALQDLKLTDSFMKEAQRLNPAFLTAFLRATAVDVTLSDGTFIPKDTFVCSPNTVLRNTDLYGPEPDVLDPYRFFNLRTNPDAPNPFNHASREQYQYVSPTKEHMGFGIGKHACPGRFLAANEVKLILSRILLEFEVAMPDGSREPYKQLTLGLNNIPDTSKHLLMRDIKEPEVPLV